MDLINTSFLHNKEVVMVIRLVVAAILGGIVGIERGSGDRPAGFRTHILVCVGSALFMLVSLYGFDDVYPQTAKLEEDIGQRRDSARIAAQVVSGIGFLGAGTILHEGLTIRGLTTAASLWMVCCRQRYVLPQQRGNHYHHDNSGYIPYLGKALCCQQPQ